MCTHFVGLDAEACFSKGSDGGAELREHGGGGDCGEFAAREDPVHCCRRACVGIGEDAVCGYSLRSDGAQG